MKKSKTEKYLSIPAYHSSSSCLRFYLLQLLMLLYCKCLRWRFI